MYDNFWSISFRSKTPDTKNAYTGKYQVNISSITGKVLLVAIDDKVKYQSYLHETAANELSKAEAIKCASALIQNFCGISATDIASMREDAQYYPSTDDADGGPFSMSMWSVSFTDDHDVSLHDEFLGFSVGISAKDGRLLVLYRGDEEIYRIAEE
jgi:hypothetical protein